MAPELVELQPYLARLRALPFVQDVSVRRLDAKRRAAPDFELEVQTESGKQHLFAELVTVGNTVGSNVCEVRVTNRMALRESVERNPPIWRSGNAASSTAAYVLSIPAPASWKKYRGIGVAVRLRMSLTFAGVRFGFTSSIKAIAPATCGAENDVPVAVV
mgnify:CR=1 FL=1